MGHQSIADHYIYCTITYTKRPAQTVSKIRIKIQTLESTLHVPPIHTNAQKFLDIRPVGLSPDLKPTEHLWDEM